VKNVSLLDISKEILRRCHILSSFGPTFINNMAIQLSTANTDIAEIKVLTAVIMKVSV
jgi:hypothetical protein